MGVGGGIKKKRKIMKKPVHRHTGRQADTDRPTHICPTPHPYLCCPPSSSYTHMYTEERITKITHPQRRNRKENMHIQLTRILLEASAWHNNEEYKGRKKKRRRK